MTVVYIVVVVVVVVFVSFVCLFVCLSLSSPPPLCDGHWFLL